MVLNPPQSRTPASGTRQGGTEALAGFSCMPPYLLGTALEVSLSLALVGEHAGALAHVLGTRDLPGDVLCTTEASSQSDRRRFWYLTQNDCIHNQTQSAGCPLHSRGRQPLKLQVHLVIYS